MKSLFLDDFETVGIGNCLGGSHGPVHGAGIDGDDFLILESLG
jgi:hypothetical protein